MQQADGGLVEQTKIIPYNQGQKWYIVDKYSIVLTFSNE